MGWTFFDITVFLHFFYPSYILFKEPFEFYITYAFILLYLPLLITKYKVNSGVWWMLVVLLITGLFNVYLGNDTVKNFFKIYLNIGINLVFYGLIMDYYNYDINKMFKMYLRGALIVCAFGLIQIISYKIGFKYGYDIRYWGFANKWGITPGGLGIRVNSTFPEPAFFAEFMSPAAAAAVFTLIFRKNIFLKNYEAIIILVAFFLSFSSLAFTALFVILILFLVNFGMVRYFIFALPVAVLLFYFIYNNAEEFKGRMDGLKLLFVDDYLMEEKDKEIVGSRDFINRQYRVITKVHGSPLVLYNNYYVAKQNFSHNPLFGSGLGSHEIAFDQYNLNYLVSKWYVLNTPDANSMGLRIISELGLMGIIFVILFIKRGFVQRNPSSPDDYSWVIATALLAIIIIQILRQGNYTYAGFFFYGWLYYYNKINYEKKYAIKEIQNTN